VLFARANPEHKLRIVSILKEDGKIVAVTGDGVNDAPALKKADIGVAMGIAGTDVAKEASEMILLDDNFATIVAAIEEGRAIYANIKKFSTYILASNVPEVFPFIAFIMLRIPLPLTIMQILTVDLGTDIMPALGLAGEKPEPGIMDQPPRARNVRLFNLPLLLRAYGFLGMIEGFICLAAFYLMYILNGWRPGQPMAASGYLYAAATTMCLASIVAGQIGNIFSCRTERESIFKIGFHTNRLVLFGILVELILLNIIIYFPPFQKIFNTAPIGLINWAVLLIFPPIVLFMEEGRKLIIRLWYNKRKGQGGV
jgi:magnesium-transporting ATPase (P-type)